MNTRQRQAIRESAYYKWEQSGRHPGDDLKFWLEAEVEFFNRQQSVPELDVVQEASEGSFPASDSPAWPMTTVGVHPRVARRSGRFSK